MLQATTFAIHVTYTCPLTCAHCCFNSSPQVRESLSPELIKDVIDELPPTIEGIAFTGGEPFLHGRNLYEYISLAKARGLKTRVVTSAYFGVSEKDACRRMRLAKEAGLDELSISWDDFHEEFVPFSAVLNVARAASEYEIVTAINAVQLSASRWTRERIMSCLGSLADSVSVVVESNLNLTGRAERELADKPKRPENYLGPCPYVCTGPTLSGKGHLLPCCGVIPHTERLVIERNISASNIANGIKRGLSNPLFLWLFLRGPYALLKDVSERYGVSIPPREDIGGNCEACKILLTNQDIESKIDEIIAERLEIIAHELLLLESLGLLDAKKIAVLWRERSLARIGL